MRRKIIIGIFVVLALALIAWLLLIVFTKPSNDRNWTIDNEILPYAEFNGDEVTVYNIRNFEYRSVSDYTPQYYDKTFDLNKIQTVDFINVPFSGVAAHTFLSFGFEGGDYIAISVEARREKGEDYSIYKGMLRQFEVMYVIADERDVVRLRTNYRGGEVYMYPMKIEPKHARALFVDILNKTNELKNTPEFYNTITNNCTTKLVEHVNNIADDEHDISFSIRYVLPKLSDRLAYDLGFVDDTGTFEEIKQKYNISEIAREVGDDPEFSVKIRENL